MRGMPPDGPGTAATTAEAAHKPQTSPSNHHPRRPAPPNISVFAFIIGRIFPEIRASNLIVQNQVGADFRPFN
jgi:hypothetical protein